MKKIVIVDDGEALLSVLDRLSIASCERLEAWLMSQMRTIRGRTTLQQGLATLHTSMIAHVASDDKGTDN
jgi:hypothetical protein